MPDSASKVLALSGGVGGAKLALGLANVLPPEALTIVANTGDDFSHMGLSISPDLDTVMYTLAGLSNKEVGWGLAGETWHFMEALKQLQGESWFQLGDRDLATHIMRTQWLAEGKSLSEITELLCQRLGIEHRIVPMTDDPVATLVNTAEELLAFQHYFVRDRCKPVVTGFEFSGIASAAPAPGFAAALEDPELNQVIICPSNPFVSVDPVLKLPGVETLLTKRRPDVPVVAVSPIVGGQAIKGPAAKMMAELGMPTTCLAVAQHYEGRIDALVLDRADEADAPAIEALGMATLVTDTIMVSLADRVRLAEETMALADKLRQN